MRFYFLALLALAADQVSKIWVRTHLKVGESIVVWDPVLDFTRYENSGIARSMLQGYGRYFVIAAALVIFMIGYFRNKGELKGPVLGTGAALLAGGAAGNAVDRLLFNQVTDFIAFRSHNGILNLADYAITWGGALIVLGVVLEGWRSARQARLSRQAREEAKPH
ncbi:signal peptidase II [Cohnella caldifontis]|uniref:signal peptidase II n=1 Tax=Cohnella caldifontis TaxID=3027471 RepID=UPI0023EDDA2E|nr:signal peptidase II [Cohnella sp. YIM B05605]